VMIIWWVGPFHIVWTLLSAVAGLELLLPHLAGVVVDAIQAAGDRLRIMVRAVDDG